uniref:Craniofacial development protein 2-like n=1 Tax=Nicotiana tabacum TaxID=4097 RepID=A0A1S3YWS1_TOBAC|nr:PREDICTED: uncharacterized protein LOC107780459 [Nicotiana tabacum]
MLLDFAKAFGLVIVNSIFPKRNEHLVTFQNAVAKTQIDYLLLMRCDSGLCKDCKVIPHETLATQHRLLMIDVGIRLKRRKRTAQGTPRISNGDANTMWSATSDYIRASAREVLGSRPVSLVGIKETGGGMKWSKVSGSEESSIYEASGEHR